MECQKEFGMPPPTSFVKKEQNDQLAYEVKCPYGHTSIVIQQAFKFEILFDMACICYLNKDYTSAVKHCATAIERFHECFVQSVWFTDDKPFNHLEESYNLYWKQVKNSSERQLGTFYSFYLKKYQKLEYDITSKKAPFRNNVVHKGHICEESEAYDYMELTYNYIRYILKQIHRDFEKGLHYSIGYNMHQIAIKYIGLPLVTYCDPHIISSVSSEETNTSKTLKEIMKSYQERINLEEFHYNSLK